MFYICLVKQNLETLKTIKNYAMQEKVTTSYIYKLVKENKMSVVVIDGVQFIDTKQFPTLPNRK